MGVKRGGEDLNPRYRIMLGDQRVWPPYITETPPFLYLFEDRNAPYSGKVSVHRIDTATMTSVAYNGDVMSGSEATAYSSGYCFLNGFIYVSSRDYIYKLDELTLTVERSGFYDECYRMEMTTDGTYIYMSSYVAPSSFQIHKINPVNLTTVASSPVIVAERSPFTGMACDEAYLYFAMAKTYKLYTNGVSMLVKMSKATMQIDETSEVLDNSGFRGLYIDNNYLYAIGSNSQENTNKIICYNKYNLSVYKKYQTGSVPTTAAFIDANYIYAISDDYLFKVSKQTGVDEGVALSSEFPDNWFMYDYMVGKGSYLYTIFQDMDGIEKNTVQKRKKSDLSIVSSFESSEDSWISSAAGLNETITATAPVEKKPYLFVTGDGLMYNKMLKFDLETMTNVGETPEIYLDEFVSEDIVDICTDGIYIYTLSLSSQLAKIDPKDMSVVYALYVADGNNAEGDFDKICYGDGNIFLGGGSRSYGEITKVDRDTGIKIGSCSNRAYGRYVVSMTYSGGFVYYFDSARYLYKVNSRFLSTASTFNYSSIPGENLAYCRVIDGFLYALGDGGKIFKFDIETISTKTEYVINPVGIWGWGCYIDKEYIYTAPGYEYKIYKYRISDCTLVDEEDVLNDYYTLTGYGEYLYGGGNSGDDTDIFIYENNKSDLAFTRKTLALDDAIWTSVCLELPII